MGHEILNSIDELIGKKCEFYDDDYYKGTFTIVGHEVSIEDGSNSINIMDKLTDDKKLQMLKSCFEDTIWMAIRYAHGRHTYAPSMVRDAINKFKIVYPNWEPKEDKTIEAPNEEEIIGFSLRSDYLDDVFVTNKT